MRTATDQLADNSASDGEAFEGCHREDKANSTLCEDVQYRIVFPEKFTVQEKSSPGDTMDSTPTFG